MDKKGVVEAIGFGLGALAFILVLALLTGCAAPREPTVCGLAQKYPETKDPVVASLFGLPTAGCL